jgi:hypothetical protein
MQSTLLLLTQRDPESGLDNALSEHVIFHSPVRDYHGRADVAHILMTIAGVLDEIEAHRELVAERQVVTIITAAHAHHRMSGVLHETHDALGRVERATLLLRPLSTLLEAITAMRAALERSPLPSTLGAGTGPRAFIPSG